MPSKRALSYLLTAMSLVVLSACGGSGGAQPEPPTPPSSSPPPPPPSAEPTSGLEISVLTEEPNVLNVVAGESSDHRIILAKIDESIDADLDIKPDILGTSIVYDNNTPYLSIDASLLPPGATSVTIVATNRDNGLEEESNVTVNVLDLVTVASGRLDWRGGAVSSRGGLIGVRVDPDELSNSLNLEIRAAETKSGSAVFRIVFDRDITAETAQISLFSNENASSLDEVTSARNVQKVEGVSSENLGQLLPVEIRRYTGFFHSGVRLDPGAKSLTKWSTSCSLQTTGPAPPGSGFTICATRKDDAAVLSSSHTIEAISAAKVDGKEIVPVLFIHGYTRELSGLGGGEDTWGEFRERVSGMSDEDKEYVAFEFQWRTNASFRIVADDLSGAVSSIHRITEQPVRVVAHSFGGILVRTLLQGNARSANSFDSQLIRSVMTLGTPHSGIFEQQTNSQNGEHTFPDGQDSWAFWFCGQVSCYQMGEDVSSARIMPALSGAGTQGDVLEYLRDAGLPEQTPLLVGIGLKKSKDDNDIYIYDEGDGLITYEGQRIAQSGWNSGADGDLVAPDLLDCDSSAGAYTKEVLLGADGKDDRPGNPVNAQTLGYSHSTSWPAAPAADLEYSQAYIKPGEVHDSFEQFRRFIELTDSVDDPCVPNDYVPPSIDTTMLGTTVSVAINWPNLGNIATVPFATTVGASVEFPSRIYQDADTGDSISPILKKSDVGANYIDINFLQTARADSTEFNGDVYDLLDEDAPRIVRATLDPTLSTFTEAEVEIDSTENRVLVNFSGAFITDGDRIYVNLELAPP